MSVKILCPAQTIVGESIVWDERRGCLFWVDIVGKAIHSFDLASGTHHQTTTPDIATSIGLTTGRAAVVGLRKTVCLWDHSTGFHEIAAIECDPPANRLNEGVVAPDGSFWVGTMQNNIAKDGTARDITEATGRIYRVTAAGQVSPVTSDRFGITNSFVWTEAGDLITADTLENTLYRYRRPAGSDLYQRIDQLLADFPRGLPDGSCVDADGYIWNCRVAGGGCIVRLTPEGEVVRIVELPCSWPTSCCFGGEDFATLFVTTARFTMDAVHLARHPQEGAVLAVDTGVRGCPAHRFDIGDLVR